ncbi:hypothetical protein B0H17DRAFT_1338360 [Mycena rosella]|uniref:Uncharacterized protein n=1 Tax=Mycena rosella TaxID=1033263 RepID=A0AAD7CMX0_MYCRO|nr:hypothetical protein B0H17DRAFT_1338360 [Mycena rosella]
MSPTRASFFYREQVFGKRAISASSYLWRVGSEHTARGATSEVHRTRMSWIRQRGLFALRAPSDAQPHVSQDSGPCTGGALSPAPCVRLCAVAGSPIFSVPQAMPTCLIPSVPRSLHPTGSKSATRTRPAWVLSLSLGSSYSSFCDPSFAASTGAPDTLFGVRAARGSHCRISVRMFAAGIQMGVVFGFGRRRSQGGRVEESGGIQAGCKAGTDPPTSVDGGEKEKRSDHVSSPSIINLILGPTIVSHEGIETQL